MFPDLIPCLICGLRTRSIFLERHLKNSHGISVIKYKKEHPSAKTKHTEKEGVDWVTCLECGHRAKNLSSHIKSKHPDYKTKHPDARVTVKKQKD
jgi:predicted transcriptional regulator